MEKVFITGGAGFLGINLTRFFLDKGYSIVSFDLDGNYNYPEKENPNVDVIKGDIRNLEHLSKAMKGCHLVVHAAAALPLYSKEEIYSTDILGTENVLKATMSNNIRRMIMISSTAVYGISTQNPMHENDPLIAVGPYGEAKIKSEDLCLEYREKGLIVPIIRPKTFIGPERLGVFALFYDWAKDGKNFPMIGSGKNKYQFLDVYDLCDVIYKTAILEDSVVNDTFNVGAEHYTTMKEDYQVVLDKAGFGKKIIGFPAAPMIWTLRALEFFHLSPIYKWVYETASKDSFVSIEKAKEKLGFSPVYSNKEALLRNYEWYLNNIEQFTHARGVSHRVPWKQGILKGVKFFF